MRALRLVAISNTEAGVEVHLLKPLITCLLAMCLARRGLKHVPRDHLVSGRLHLLQYMLVSVLTVHQFQRIYSKFHNFSREQFGPMEKAEEGYVGIAYEDDAFAVLLFRRGLHFHRYIHRGARPRYISSQIPLVTPHEYLAALADLHELPDFVGAGEHRIRLPLLWYC